MIGQISAGREAKLAVGGCAPTLKELVANHPCFFRFLSFWPSGTRSAYGLRGSLRDLARDGAPGTEAAPEKLPGAAELEKEAPESTDSDAEQSPQL